MNINYIGTDICIQRNMMWVLLVHTEYHAFHESSHCCCRSAGRTVSIMLFRIVFNPTLIHRLWEQYRPKTGQMPVWLNTLQKYPKNLNLFSISNWNIKKYSWFRRWPSSSFYYFDFIFFSQIGGGHCNLLWLAGYVEKSNHAE